MTSGHYLSRRHIIGLQIALALTLVYFFVGLSKPTKMTTIMMPTSSSIEQTFFTSTVQPNTSTVKKRVILFWTDWFGYDFMSSLKVPSGNVECGPKKHICYTTKDRKYFSNSSAVIFHLQSHNLMSNRPYLLSLKRPPEQRWIFYTREAPPLNPGQATMRQWNSLFNWTMTYKLDSDIRFTTGAEIIPNQKYQGGFDPNKNYLEGRKKMAIALISKCHQHRLTVVKKLKEHIDVDIYGKCGKRCKPYDSCYSSIPQYKFYLAFENAVCRDYITEKTLINAFEKGTVPVIISGANLSNPVLIPPKSYINARDFKTIKDLANYLKKIGSQPKLYNEFFKWRDHWSLYPIGRNPKDFPCHVCEKLYEPNQQVKVYNDIASWHGLKENCESYPVWK